MLILVGHTRSKKMLEVLKRNGMSRMFVESRPDPFPAEQWGFDNGAFVWWKQGKQFDESLYAQRLQVALRCESVPYMAIVPDIVADGMKSLDYSLGWLARLPKKWPWYLVVQDGMTATAVSGVISLFDGLFLGGTDGFKATAQTWSDLAHAQGKRFHYGRAGTLAKLQHAWNVGSDSCDSAFPLWTMDRMIKFCGFNQDMRNQLLLESSNVGSEAIQ